MWDFIKPNSSLLRTEAIKSVRFLRGSVVRGVVGESSSYHTRFRLLIPISSINSGNCSHLRPYPPLCLALLLLSRSFSLTQSPSSPLIGTHLYISSLYTQTFVCIVTPVTYSTVSFDEIDTGDADARIVLSFRVPVRALCTMYMCILYKCFDLIEFWFCLCLWLLCGIHRLMLLFYANLFLKNGTGSDCYSCSFPDSC